LVVAFAAMSFGANAQADEPEEGPQGQCEGDPEPATGSNHCCTKVDHQCGGGSERWSIDISKYYPQNDCVVTMLHVNHYDCSCSS
jgi:hypothetical protein